MAKFDAGNAVEAMEYDFTAFGGSKGVVPEPESKQVDQFFRIARDLAREAKASQKEKGLDKIEEMTDAEAAEVLASVEVDDQSEEYENRLSEAVGALCTNSPPAAEIKRLPFRVRAAFMSWLIGQLRPEAPRPATKR